MLVQAEGLDQPTSQASPASSVIRARGLGKAYYPSASGAGALVAALRGRTPTQPPFWALKPLDLEVTRGEVLGLVGHNGAGKSTLLQILSGTLAPSVGTLEVRGRVAALLELGAGFNPEFTGRENLLLNGPLLGLSRAELAERLPAIIEFSGIGPFIDQPVKTYSSGMFVRLAFSLATSVDPEVLVVDEALSVGDGEFARKSFDRILALRERGTTILFCSHSMYQIESLCSRALWLDHGEARMLGAPSQVTAAYQEHLDRRVAGQEGGVGWESAGGRPSAAASPAPPRQDGAPASAAGGQPAAVAAPVITSPGHARIRRLVASSGDQTGRRLYLASGKSDLAVSIGYESDVTLDTPHAAVTIEGSDGRILASTGTWVDGVQLSRDADGRGRAELLFPALPLLKGRYTVSAYLFCERGLHIYSAAERFAELSIEQDHLEQGFVSLPHRWAGEAGWGGVESQSEQTQPSREPLTPPAPESPEAPELPESPEAPLPPLKLPPDWSSRYHTRWARPADEPALLDLFERAFGHRLSLARWRWKYRDATGWGTLVEQAPSEEQAPAEAAGNQGPVAFFGGMPRRFHLRGQAVQAVQIGDVMVDPAHRGALSRQGPLFRASAAYIANMYRLIPALQFAFGFPHARAMRLGEVLGLYREVDRISAIAWPALTPRRSLAVRMQTVVQAPNPPLPPHPPNPALDLDPSLDLLWQAMQRDWPDLLLPVRNAPVWHRRYHAHPEHRYTLVLLSRRLTGAPLAALVLRVMPDELEWLDYVGPRDGIAPAIRAARMQAAMAGRTRVGGWFTQALVPLFARDEAQVTPTEVRIPVDQQGQGPSAALWLMSGDTDFR